MIACLRPKVFAFRMLSPPRRRFLGFDSLFASRSLAIERPMRYRLSNMSNNRMPGKLGSSEAEAVLAKTPLSLAFGSDGNNGVFALEAESLVGHAVCVGEDLKIPSGSRRLASKRWSKAARLLGLERPDRSRSETRSISRRSKPALEKRFKEFPSNPPRSELR